MRWRQVGMLYAGRSAVLAALYAPRAAAPARGEPIRSRPPRPRFLQLTAADVTGIRLVRGDAVVSMRRDGGGVGVERAGGRGAARATS